MPITYTPAKSATQAPSAPPAPNGATVLDAVDYNTINEGVAAVTTFANQLETSISGKADVADIPDVSDFVKVDGTTAFTAPQQGVTPTAAEHLTTKDYVDTNFVENADLTTAVAGMVKADGSVPFTAVQSGVTPTADAHLATKGYADDAITTALSDYVQETFLTANYTDNTGLATELSDKETEIKEFYSAAADAATAGAAEVGAYYGGAASTVQAALDAIVARVAALETA